MKIGINAKVDVEVLRRGKKDTNSASQQVIELLEEYIRLREQNEDDILQEVSEQFKEMFSLDFIKQFLEDPDKLPKKQKNLFATELKKIGYDINYRKYLKKYNDELDEFAVLIDRDMQTHSESNMLECIKYCRDNGYKCYIANPCFEFWLLMHLADIEVEFGDQLDKIKENKKVSEQHTFVQSGTRDATGRRAGAWRKGGGRVRRPGGGLPLPGRHGRRRVSGVRPHGPLGRHLCPCARSGRSPPHG